LTVLICASTLHDAAYTEMMSALESAPGQGMNKEIYAFRYVDPLEEGKTR